MQNEKERRHIVDTTKRMKWNVTSTKYSQKKCRSRNSRYTRTTLSTIVTSRISGILSRTAEILLRATKKEDLTTITTKRNRITV